MVARRLLQLQIDFRFKAEKMKKGEKKFASNICHFFIKKVKLSQKQPPIPPHNILLLTSHCPKLGFMIDQLHVTLVLPRSASSRRGGGQLLEGGMDTQEDARGLGSG